MKILVAYDITDNRRRNRLAKTLLNYLVRVQFSVFQGSISKEKLNELRKEISKIIKVSEDSVIIIKLCTSCVEKTELHGIIKGYELEGPIII